MVETPITSNERLFEVAPKEQIGFDVTVEVDDKGEVPRKWIILRDSDPNGPTIFDVEDALALRTWLNKVLAKTCLCDNYTTLICPMHGTQSAPETSALSRVLEVGENLAKAADAYRVARNDLDKADEIGATETQGLHDIVADCWRGLGRAIHEFRKHALRVKPSVEETSALLQWRDGLPYVSGVIATYDKIVMAARSAAEWKRRLEEQIDYSGKLQRLIECYCAGDALPYPEFHHHQLLLECHRARLAEKASACPCRCHSSAGTGDGPCIYCGHSPQNGSEKPDV